MLYINDILTNAPNKKSPFPGIVRVVAISEDGTITALMKLDDFKTSKMSSKNSSLNLHAPFNIETRPLIESIKEKRTIKLDSFKTNLATTMEQLSPYQQQELKNNLKLLEPFLDDVYLILDSEYRIQSFEFYAKKSNTNLRTLQRLFYKYLWGGMTKYALTRTLSKNQAKTLVQTKGAKRGPKSDNKNGGNLPLQKIRKSLESGAKLYYLSGKHTLKEAFVLTKKKFFSNSKKLTHEKNGCLALEEILLPGNKLPTARQFRYICDSLKDDQKRKKRPRHFTQNKTKDIQRGTARQKVSGPGYRYEIDATKLQVQLVSRFDRKKLVCEATLYIIIDVWSGAIVGYAISHESASWSLASKALHNCFTDKSIVFKRLNLPHTSQDWHSKHLPTRLSADRGEIVSSKAGVVPEIGIKVEIMPSMRPDRKGKVESQFNAIKYDNNFYHIPGRHKKNPGRRENNGKSSAALHIQELEYVIVEIIMDLNRDPVPAEHIPLDALEAGITSVTHDGLFAWGLEHRIGFTRTLDSKSIFTHLMAKDIASVTARGIYYKKQYYVSKTLVDSGYQTRAVHEGRFKIDIRYDDHFSDQIWFFDQYTDKWVPALNDNEEIMRYKLSFLELSKLLTKAELLVNKAKEENIHKKSEKAPRINSITKQAEKEAKAVKKGLSKSKLQKDAKSNNVIEKEISRIKASEEALYSYASGIRELRDEASSNNITTSQPLSSDTSLGNLSQKIWGQDNAELDK